MTNLGGRIKDNSPQIEMRIESKPAGPGSVLFSRKSTSAAVPGTIARRRRTANG